MDLHRTALYVLNILGFKTASNKTKAWKDIVSGDTMCSDSYPHSLIFDGAVLEVRGRPTRTKAPIVVPFLGLGFRV